MFGHFTTLCMKGLKLHQTFHKQIENKFLHYQYDRRHN